MEEELLLVDPDRGEPRAVAPAALRFAHPGERLETELQREQLETTTRPCHALADLGEQIRDARLAASRAARSTGAEVAALATSPVRVQPSLTPSVRYRRMAAAYARTAAEQLTCGCHVHVEVSSPDEGIGVLDRIRSWLAPLLALSANSPFWQSRDTGYASFRQQVWVRWPSAGPTGLFGSFRRYRAVVEDMVGSGVLLDEGMIYFDARLSRHYPTVEVRIADVCLRADDTVLIAGLVRALVETAARQWRAGEPPDPVRTELLRLAAWRASRSALHGDLLHPVTHHPVPAHRVVRALLAHVRPALAAAGDLNTVEHLLCALLCRGSGADLQRAAHRRTRDVAQVVSDAITCTLS
ncbi:carboxylate--amine ligase [Actinomadura craniellae]|uniref:Putative glutamate--cysteine ligase 2 n=1 Tax=Actinomadura craniellae TaxID=2231787 RepID=A0A365H0F0_9ACTN|nr:carboxylate--amine ligase [Actinomadura craniellae]